MINNTTPYIAATELTDMIVYANNTEDAEPQVRRPREEGTFIPMSS